MVRENRNGLHTLVAIGFLAGVCVVSTPSDAAAGAPLLARTTIAAGDSHSLLLKSDGTLWSFGGNEFGQLGTTANNATTNPNPTPVQVLTNVASVAAGASHSLALKNDGSLWAFGSNEFGQLGSPTNSGSLVANPVPTQVLSDVIAIAAGRFHSLALKSDGSLWSFGLNVSGQLGTVTNSGTNSANPSPIQVLTNVVAIAAGGSHSLALRSDGKLWTFGDNQFGQLGVATNVGTNAPNPTPQQVLTGATAVAAGIAHTTVLRIDGTVWSFGSNEFGQLGRPTNSGTNNPNSSPVQVLGGVKEIAAGDNHSLGLKGDGSVWSFGLNEFGQLGNATNSGSTSPNSSPTQVLTGIIEIAAGGSHTMAVESDGSLSTFGSNLQGQLGSATNSGTTTPNPAPIHALVGLYPSNPATAIAAGGRHSLVLRSDGTLLSFGSNEYGQLGNSVNSGTDVPNPQPVQVLTDVKAIAAGTDHTMALKNDGTLWTFGSNLHGQLGFATNSGTTTPNPVATQVLDHVISIAAGGTHSLALKDDFTLWTFGDNEFGELGSSVNMFGGSANSTPAQVLTGVTRISAGARHSLVLKSDNTLWTFGQNYEGQLGYFNNYETTNPAPHQVLTSVMAVAGGGFHTLALKTDGTLWTFGSNYRGELGTEANYFKGLATYAPAQVLSDVSAIAAGGAHTLALKTDGTLWTFGQNFRGQLGLGTSFATYNPTLALNDVDEIAAGSEHSLVLKADGTVLAFGNNSDGQLGTSINSSSSLPNPVAIIDNAGNLSPSLLLVQPSIAAGDAHSMVVKYDGTLWTFGSNDKGQLARTPVNSLANPAPTQVLTQVKAAAGNSLILKTDGTLWSVGNNFSGQLGIASTDTFSHPSPAQVLVLTDVVTVAGGYNHNLALQSDGTLWAFGSNFAGQLGEEVGGFQGYPIATPTQVLTDVAAIAAGREFSLALKSDGTLWSFGFNRYGQLGHDLHIQDHPPSLISLNSVATHVMSGVVAIAAGTYHSLALKSDGTLWTFGRNYFGELGNTTNNGATNTYPPDYTPANPVPTQVMNGVAKIAAGGSHSVALKSDGTVWTFGSNFFGQLGNAANTGTYNPNPVPTQVVGLSNVTEIAAGGAHSMAVKADGTLWTFGSNASGQLGRAANINDENAANPVPTKVMEGLYPPGPSTFESLVPGRLLDSRLGGSTADHQFEGIGVRVAGSTTELLVAGRGGVPGDALAVVLNVTVTGAQGGGYVTVYPCGEERPNSSNLNYVAGGTIPNLVITKIGTDGKVCIFTSAGVNLLADVSGYYGP